MRTSILYLFSILTLITSQLSSQSTDSLTSKTCLTIKTDLLTPLTNLAFWRLTGTLTLEVGFAHRHSIQLTGLYGIYKHGGDPFPNGVINIQSQIRTQGIADYKCFWKRDNNFKGFYSGIYLRLINNDSKYSAYYPAHLTTSLFYIQQTGLGAGGIIGYQTYFKKHFVLDFLIGLGARNVFINPTVNNTYVPLAMRTGVDGDIRTTVNIGYRF